MSPKGATRIYSPRYFAHDLAAKEIARSKMQRRIYKFVMRLKLINFFAAPS
jgi:pyruvate-formate lyase